MTLILTQEGIERIWEFYEDPYLTDEESEADSILRMLSTWGPRGAGTNPDSAHAPHRSPWKAKGPYPFEKENFINAILRMYGPKSTSMDREKLEQILSGLYDVGYIDDVENVRTRKDYPHGKIRSAEHTAHWYGKNWRSDSPNKEWTGRLKEVSDEKSSLERWEYIKRRYPDRFPEDF